MVNLRHVLVPVDFSETSDRALDYAMDLAEKFGADVTVMHAYQIPVYGFPDGAFITSADVATQISQAAQERLNAIVKAREGKSVAVRGVLRDGVAWEEVSSVAAEMKADLVVIGTHGRRGLARALLGSVAENVIRTCELPVLVIHGARDTH